MLEDSFNRIDIAENSFQALEEFNRDMKVLAMNAY